MKETNKFSRKDAEALRGRRMKDEGRWKGEVGGRKDRRLEVEKMRRQEYGSQGSEAGKIED